MSLRSENGLLKLSTLGNIAHRVFAKASIRIVYDKNAYEDNMKGQSHRAYN